MSMFDNIVFDEFTLLEGEQAEEYKKRKASEKAEEDKKYRDQANKRYPSVANSYTYNYGDKHKKNPKQKEDAKKAIDGDEEAKKRFCKRFDSDSKRMSAAENKAYYSGERKRSPEENARASDTINRHMRRHPKQYKESVVLALIEAYEPEFTY